MELDCGKLPCHPIEFRLVILLLVYPNDPLGWRLNHPGAYEPFNKCGFPTKCGTGDKYCSWMVEGNYARHCIAKLDFSSNNNSFYFYSVPLHHRVRLRYLPSIPLQTGHTFVASLNSRSAVLSWENEGIRQDGSRCGSIKSLYRRRASSQVQSIFPLPPRLGSRIS